MNPQTILSHTRPWLLYTIPFIALSIVVEYYHTRHNGHPTYEKKDVRASLGIGLGSLLINGLLKTVPLSISIFCYELVPWRLPHAWWVWVLAFLGIDLSNYVAHYVAHKQRVWWATHVTHHSSEHMNLSTAFRNSWTQYLKVIFFIPVWSSGIHPIITFTCYQLDLLYQFWIHAATVPKLPRWMEWLFVTPSHHRVHHGKNPKYIDKNFGSTFMVWDRLFGTFQEENETPVYGITKPVESFNVFYLNFHEWVDLWKDVRRSKSIRQAFAILFGPP